MKFIYISIAMCLIVMAELDAANPEYCPGKEGSEWIYTYDTYSADGSKRSGLMHRILGRAVVVDGKTYNEESILPNGRPQANVPKILRRKDENGVYTRSTELSAAEVLSCKLPLEIGARWKAGKRRDEIHTVTTVESVTVHGKLYEQCYRISVRNTSGDLIQEYWEAPDVGNVKTVASKLDGSKTIIQLREMRK